jgi:hypothetical protein
MALWPKFTDWLSVTKTKITGLAPQDSSGTIVTSSAGTYTVPTTAAYVKVSMVGGGGGGSGTVANVAGYAGGASGNITISNATIGAGGVGGHGAIYATHSYGSTAYPSLTAEEQKELDLLREETKASSKVFKLNIFRELHPDMRQMVIAMITWQQYRDSISSAKTVSTRQQELEMKASMASGGLYNGYNYNVSNTATICWSGSLIPDGLTREDLIEAHTSACLEEELLK